MNPQDNGTTGPGVNDFLAEINQEAKTAVDTPVAPPVVDEVITPQTGGAFRIFPKAEPQPEPQPIFEAAMNEAANPKPTVDGMTMEAGMKLRDYFQSQLLARISGVKDAEKFKLTDDEFEMLMIAWKPYAPKVGGVIPDWVILLGMETFIMGGKIATALDDRKFNQRNQQAASGKATANTPASTVGSKERTRFKIHPNGCYTHTRNGDYVKKDDTTGERVNLTDRKEVEEAIFSNGWDKFRDAYHLPDTWAADNKYDIENA